MGSWVRVVVVGITLTICGVSASASVAAGTPGGVTPDIPTGGHLPRLNGVPSRSNLDWQGGFVMHTNRTHIIFWNPSNCTVNSAACAYGAGYKALMDGYLTNVASDSHRASNVFALTGQYFDAGGHAVYDSTFAGALDDTDAAPTGGCTLPTGAPTGWVMCVTDAQIQAELSSFISSHSLPDTIADLYFLVTPEGFGSCTGSGPLNCSLGGSANSGYCGYHSFFGNTTAAPGIYANIPFDAEPGHCQSGNPRPNGSAADPTLSTMSHEQSEAITDPFPAGAGNSQTGWVDGNPSSSTFQEEIGDLCATSYGTALGSTAFGLYNENVGSGHYLLQEEWSNEDGGGSCQQLDETDTVDFTASGSPVAGGSVSLLGHGIDPDGSIAAYAWRFGDGSTAANANANHRFSHTGTFAVTLTVQDTAGQRVSASHLIQIVAATISKVSTRAGKRKGTISVKVNGAGTVRVGNAQRKLSSAGTVVFTIRLGAKGRKRLARKDVHAVKVKVKVTFLRGGAAAQTKTAVVRFHD